MSATKPKVGDEVEVPEMGTVERPDGTRLTVAGGVYVFDVPGEHIVDGKKHEVS